MNPGRANSKLRNRGSRSGITVLELLVVIAIIVLLSAVALPAIKGLTRSNLITSANRQLLDTIALARQRAISERTWVHIIFVPPSVVTADFSAASPKDRKLAEHLKGGAYTSFALFAERTVGDQPGQPHYRYLSSWHTLPEGVFIADWEFNSNLGLNQWLSLADTNRPFQFAMFPFPSSTGTSNLLAHIAFDPQGRLLKYDAAQNERFDDEVISLARGSILAARDGTGKLVDFDVRENPAGNSTNELYNRIRIDGLTGRGRIERWEGDFK